MKTIIGNALLPVVTYLTEKVSAFIDFMVKNEDLTKGIFAGMASVLGVILIPLLAKAAIAVLGFIAPFLPAILIVAALGTAIGLLYEDYKIWSEGGKSLFDWGKFVGYIKTTNFSVDNLLKAFTYLLTGYTDWSSAAKGLLDWLKMKGFIDETGVSIKSLWTGFKNLASELKDSVMPYLMDFVDVLMQVKDGNFAGAWESMKKSGIRALGSMKDMVGGGR